MYLEHFGLSEPPFRITPHTDFFFSGANRGPTLDALIYAITHDEGIIKITGEVGSGKTMLCRVLMERLPAQVVFVYLANPSLSRDDILYALAEELHIEIPERSRASTVLRLLQNRLIELYGAGKRVVVVVDEAHAMPAETLEEIRLLSNLESNRNKLLQLVLFGQPELNDMLSRADMRQLKERITHNFLLEPLVRDDIAEYLEFRMRAAGYRGPNVFSPAATRLIAESSKGLTRRINILADKALLAAFSGNTHQINAKEVRAAIKDCEFSNAYVTATPQPRPRLIAGITAGIVGIGVIGYFVTRETGSPLPSAPVASQPTATATAPQPVSPAPAVPTAAAPAQPAITQPTMPDAVKTPATSTPPPVPQTLLEQHLSGGQTWLASATDDRWFLQLYSTDATQTRNVETFLKQARSEGIDISKLRVYRSDLSGKMRYGVVYGDYPSSNAALSAARQLPATIREKKPFPRQVIRLR